ncbi:MAG: hypothetical protein DDT20_01867 [Firmicutes bacterium]|nr:hypothetical protein [Bacillota bacterium]
MWLSQLCLVLFAGALLAVVLFAPWIVAWFIRFSRADIGGAHRLFLATIYAGAVPAVILWYSLFSLLLRVARRQMFCAENVVSLRRISWSCIVGAFICVVSASYYLPWLMVAIPAAFVGLIVRVVKNVFALGVALQAEADLTV